MSNEVDPDFASQPMPTKNNNEYIQDLVIDDLRKMSPATLPIIDDIEERKQFGIKKYGTALQAHNGRDCLQDAFEENLDLVMYLKQYMVENPPESKIKNIIGDPHLMYQSAVTMLMSIKILIKRRDANKNHAILLAKTQAGEFND